MPRAMESNKKSTLVRARPIPMLVYRSPLLIMSKGSQLYMASSVTKVGASALHKKIVSLCEL